MSTKKVLLTFDLEEFDLPEEYGRKVDFVTQIEISTLGLQRLLPLLEKYNLACTFFITATYALQHPDLVRTLTTKHEVASHGYFHSSFENADLLKSKKTLEEIIQQPVNGFRMARLAAVDEQEIKKAGYIYNSSINPTWIPGRYNHLDKPRTAFYTDAVLNIPTSVSPFFRIPLFWLGFKNYPLGFFRNLMMRTLAKDKVLSLYFHPWEFTDITNFGLPKFISKHSGDSMLKRLEKTIIALQKSGANFITIKEYISNIHK